MSTGIFNTQIPTKATSVNKSDSAVNAYSALYVGTGGDVKVTTQDGNAVTFKNVPSGGYIWMQTNLVWSTGTTASDIIGLG